MLAPRKKCPILSPVTYLCIPSMALTMIQPGIQRCIDFAGTPNSVNLLLYTKFILNFFISISVHFFDDLCDNFYEHNMFLH